MTECVEVIGRVRPRMTKSALQKFRSSRNLPETRDVAVQRMMAFLSSSLRCARGLYGLPTVHLATMSDYAAKAEDFMAKAKKKLQVRAWVWALEACVLAAGQISNWKRPPQISARVPRVCLLFHLATIPYNVSPQRWFQIYSPQPLLSRNNPNRTQGSSMLASMFGGNKYEDAAELLEKASNNYKLAKMWREGTYWAFPGRLFYLSAGDCCPYIAIYNTLTTFLCLVSAANAFVMLSECHLKADSKHDAASAMVDAANANKKVSVVDAIGNLKQALIYFNDLGRLSIAAKHVKECGELFEKEGNTDEALAAYREAGDLYAGEVSISHLPHSAD